MKFLGNTNIAQVSPSKLTFNTLLKQRGKPLRYFKVLLVIVYLLLFPKKTFGEKIIRNYYSQERWLLAWPNHKKPYRAKHSKLELRFVQSRTAQEKQSGLRSGPDLARNNSCWACQSPRKSCQADQKIISQYSQVLSIKMVFIERDKKIEGKIGKLWKVTFSDNIKHKQLQLCYHSWKNWWNKIRSKKQAIASTLYIGTLEGK